MKKFVCIYITLGIIIFMTGCEAKQKSEMVNTPNPSDEQVGCVDLVQPSTHNKLFIIDT